MRIGWLGLTILAGATLAGMAAAPAQQARQGFTFPPSVGGSRLANEIDFETRSPGLGYGAQYTRPQWSITVYVYDKRLPAIPDGAQSPIVKEEFQAASLDVLRKLETYRTVSAGGTFTIADARGRVRLACSGFVAELRAGGSQRYLLVFDGLARQVREIPRQRTAR